MSEEQDTLPQEPTEETQEDTSVQETPTEEKMYAGKFKSPEEMENAYKNLESKLGKKAYTEQLGDKIVEATGYSQEELEKAGYKPEDIVKAVITFQETGKQTPVDASSIDKTVTNSKLTETEWRLDKYEFFDEHPDMKKHRAIMDKFHKLEPTKSASEVYEEHIKPIFESVTAQEAEKEKAKVKASMDLGNEVKKEKDPTEAALKRYQDSGHIDDAAKFIEARLFAKK